MLYSLQAYRGLAVLLVVLYHGNNIVARRYGLAPLNDVFSFGFSGVHLFFVLSGFIILTAHIRDIDTPARLGWYVKRRLIRIYPIYWIVFLLLGGRKVFWGRLGIGDFLSNALFFNSGKSPIVAVSWTLTYEVIFYGIFVAFLVRRSLGAWVFAAWFVLLVLNHHYAFYPFGECLALDLLNVLFLFGLLTALAVIAVRDRLEPSLRDRIGLASLAAGTVVFACTGWYYLSLSDPNLFVWSSPPLTVGFGTGSALLLFASVSGSIEAFLKRRRLLLLIGDASYSIYLVHLYFQKRTFSAIRSLGWVPEGETTQATALLLLAAVLVVSVGCGILIHKLVEKPVLARSRAWLRIGKSGR